MPAATKAKSKKKKVYISTCANGALVMQWTDKRTLTTLSTKYGSEMEKV